MPGFTRQREEESLEELAALADTAGAKVVGRIIQNRRNVDPGTLIGKGKIQQVATMAQELDAKTIIFDADLSPTQMKNLEKLINKKVVDRSGLILDIFAGRARSREAQLQVELAQLNYFMPRLSKLWTHLSRQEGGIGTRGPGETQLETDRRAIRKRIRHLDQQLEKIGRQRATRRKHRSKFIKVALIGYTNVGKSSLMNTLAGAETFVENRLFATLDATVRSVSLEDHNEILLIDTVGFIKKLPHHLVASFRSTLEETLDADILLHVVDVSHPTFEEQIGSVLDVLHDFDIHHKPILTVFNKIDRLSHRDRLTPLAEKFAPSVFISATRGLGLAQLRSSICEMIAHREVNGSIKLPLDASRRLARIHEIARVTNTSFKEDHVVIDYSTEPESHIRIQQWEERLDRLSPEEQE
ncbi:GTPase HflX [bacterium]|nr:GTPase HflX [bacterium]